MQTQKYLSTPQMNWKSALLRFQVDTNTSPQILQSENSPTHGEKSWKNVSTFDILGADNQIKVTQRFQGSSGWQASSVHGYVSKLGGLWTFRILEKTSSERNHNNIPVSLAATQTTNPKRNHGGWWRIPKKPNAKLCPQLPRWCFYKVDTVYITWIFLDCMGVSSNSGTPKWMVYNGKTH